MIKRIIVFFLVMSIIFNGFTQCFCDSSYFEDRSGLQGSLGKAIDELSEEDAVREYLSYSSVDYAKSEQKAYTSLSDKVLLDDFEQSIYVNLQGELSDSGYIVEDVSAVYISKEYLEEIEYNSKANIWYGYSLEDVVSQMGDTKYVFTLGETGETVVKAFEAYDDTYIRALKNIAIGTGVILLCVSVSVISGGIGAPAISMVFAASAKSGAIFAASSGAISGIIAAAVTGVQTGNFDAAMKAGFAAGSESFKWGAITGAITGGATSLAFLKIASQGGLTFDEIALILKEHKLPAKFLRQIHSMEEYKELLSFLASKGVLTIEDLATICMSTKYPIEVVKLFRNGREGLIYFEEAKLYCAKVGDSLALVRSIDLTYKSELGAKTVTNLERMRQGYAAIDPITKEAYQLHHIGQAVDSPLAILTKAEHTLGDHYSILHDTSIAEGNGVHSLITNSQWAKQKKEFWKNMYEIYVSTIGG